MVNIETISLEHLDDLSALVLGIFLIIFDLDDDEHVLNNEIHYIFGCLNVMDYLRLPICIVVLRECIHFRRACDSLNWLSTIARELNKCELHVLVGPNVLLGQDVQALEERCLVSRWLR